MIHEICIIGHPSFCGGADTELFDQLKCWNKMGIKVYICHTGPINQYIRTMNLERDYGCKYLSPRQWNEVQGMHCISFCNGEFLSNIRHIKKHAKTTTFVNCMTWNFQKEIEAQFKGQIDFHLYQTTHAFEKISKNLQHLGTYRPIMFKPYFDTNAFPFLPKRPTDHFRFGRISRCDVSKFHNDQFQIYDMIQSPVPKSGVVVGWDFRIKDTMKIQTKDLSIQTKDNTKAEFYKGYIQLVKEGAINQQAFYSFCDVMIMSSDTFENLPRVGFESMSSGSILVVNNRGGWKLQVEDGKTGYLCNDAKEYIERSNLLANNIEFKEDMRFAARQKLEKEWGLEESMKSWENVFIQLENLR
jgi:glycosyltransferase involved in cell wall biosynthesis